MLIGALAPLRISFIDGGIDITKFTTNMGVMSVFLYIKSNIIKNLKVITLILNLTLKEQDKLS